MQCCKTNEPNKHHYLTVLTSPNGHKHATDPYYDQQYGYSSNKHHDQYAQHGHQASYAHPTQYAQHGQLGHPTQYAQHGHQAQYGYPAHNGHYKESHGGHTNHSAYNGSGVLGAMHGNGRFFGPGKKENHGNECMTTSSEYKRKEKHLRKMKGHDGRCSDDSGSESD